MKDCLFCQMASGSRQALTVHEDDATIVFLDHRPLFPGHCLVAPRAHFETLPDLPSDLVAPLFTTAQLVARAVEEGMQAQGTFVAINNKVSQSVPHLHIHVVPRNKKDGLRGFFWPRQPYEDDAAAKRAQEAIAAAVRRLRA
ncbi:MAG: HIT family protein [Bryobacteraceae bacterium]|nr:HIT family protein [Bryobacteraceae bacterium]